MPRRHWDTSRRKELSEGLPQAMSWVHRKSDLCFRPLTIDAPTSIIFFITAAMFQRFTTSLSKAFSIRKAFLCQHRKKPSETHFPFHWEISAVWRWYRLYTKIFAKSSPFIKRAKSRNSRKYILKMWTISSERAVCPTKKSISSTRNAKNSWEAPIPSIRATW